MSRSRVSTARNVVPIDRHTLASSGGSSGATAGAFAAAAWLRSRGVTPPTTTRWHVEIAFDVVNERAPSEFDEMTATRLHLDIYAEEWGVYFCHKGQASWIRVTDMAFVHGRDEFHLLGITPSLKDIGMLVRRLEATYDIRFQRDHVSIRTNVPGIEPAIRAWIATF